MIKNLLFHSVLLAGVLFTVEGLKGAEYLECRGGVYSQIGLDTNTYAIKADYSLGNLNYLAVYDSNGPLEVTLENMNDAFIWTRGTSNSWTLYVAGRDKMLQINKASYLNHLGSRWYALLNNLAKSGGKEVHIENLDPNIFRIVFPDKVETISSQQIISNGIEISYFDVGRLSDQTRMTNFSGWVTLKLEPISAKFLLLQAEGAVCFASKVFTNWVGESRANITNRIGVVGDLSYPSLSTNYGMVVDYRSGVRVEYGISNLISDTWPIKPRMGGVIVSNWLTAFRWVFILVAIAPGILLLWIFYKQKTSKNKK